MDADAKRFKKLQAEFNILAEQWKTTESLSERLHLLAQIKKVLDRTHKFIDDMNQLGKNRTISDATRSEKRPASAGLHTFRHALATALDSLNVPMEIRKRRIGHGRGGDVTAIYTHNLHGRRAGCGRKTWAAFRYGLAGSR